MKLYNLAFALLLLLDENYTASAPVTHNSQSLLNGDDSRPKAIIKSLKEASVIPDVLPEYFVPSFDLTVTYTSSHEQVSLGNIIPVKSTSSRPVFQLVPLNSPSFPLGPRISENKTYTLGLTDPEATAKVGKLTKAQMCHWVVSGIKLREANDIESSKELDYITYTFDLSDAQTVGDGSDFGAETVHELIKYMAPAPPAKTGQHRYTFVLLEPKEGQDGPKGTPKKPRKRPHWGYGKLEGVMEWAEDNSLQPVGANFFLAQHQKRKPGSH